MSRRVEDVIASLKLNVLEEKRAMLCFNLTPRDHYPYLRSRRIISRDDEELIDILPQTKQKVHKFLDILLRKGPTAYDELVKSLIIEQTQIFLAEELNKAFEEKKKRFDVLMKTAESSIATVTVQDNNAATKQEPFDKSIFIATSVDTSIHEPKHEHSGTLISALGVDMDKLPKPCMVKVPTTNDERECGGDIDKSSDGTCSEDGNCYTVSPSLKSESKV